MFQYIQLQSAHFKEIGIPESRKHLLVESWVLFLGIQNPGQRILNPGKLVFEIQHPMKLNLESNTWDTEVHIIESEIQKQCHRLQYVTWGDTMTL